MGCDGYVGFGAGSPLDWKSYCGIEPVMAINGEYRLSHSQEPIWTDLDTTSALGACQLNNYSMLDAESCKGDIRLNVTRHMGPVALNGSIFYSLQHYRSIGNTNIAGISVGVIF